MQDCQFHGFREGGRGGGDRERERVLKLAN